MDQFTDVIQFEFRHHPTSIRVGSEHRTMCKDGGHETVTDRRHALFPVIRLNGLQIFKGRPGDA